MSDAAAPSPLVLPSRRSFLKSSTAAAIGGGLLANLAVPRMAHADASEEIRVGLIGCGGRGTGAARQALSTEGLVKLVAMGDAFEDRLEFSLENLARDAKAKDRLDVPPDRRFSGFDAYEKVLNAGVDLVILATPPGFRPIHFKAAVDAGKHVFMEKPVAVDAPGVRAVLAATAEAKKKNLAVGVGLQRRHQTHYLEAVKRIQDGEIGDVVAARAYWNSGGVWDPRKTREECRSDMEYQMRNWYYYNWLCGDHIVEQHIHNIDVINWIKNGYPVAAQGMGGREVRTDPKYGEIFDHHAVEFIYEDGSRMFSYCRHIRNCWNAVSEHVHGSKGFANLDARSAEISVKGGSEWKYRGDRRSGDDPYQNEHDDLFASIRSNNPINEGEYGALSSMTAILGRMTTYSGKLIAWDEALNSQISLAPESYSWDAAPPTPTVAVPGQTQVV